MLIAVLGPGFELKMVCAVTMELILVMALGLRVISRPVSALKVAPSLDAVGVLEVVLVLYIAVSRDTQAAFNGSL